MDLKKGYPLQTFSILLIILSAGVFLRAYHLEDKSYGLDEEFSVRYASLTPGEIIRNVEHEPHPPLYYLILHFWIKIGGDSELMVRLLSSLFGVIAIFIMYRLGELLFNKETGIFASLILALSTTHIIHSQEARMYSLLAMLTLLSMYFLVKIMNEKRIVFVIFYLISTLSLLYTHIYGLFILLMQNLYIVILHLRAKEKPDISLKQWMGIQLLTITAFIPWFWGLLKQMGAAFGKISWLTSPPLSDLFNTLLWHSSYNPVTLALFASLSLYTILNWKRSGKHISLTVRQSENNLLLALWLFIPILVPYALSKLIVPIYSSRYTVSSSLAFYLLTARGMNRVKNNYKKGLAAAIIILAMPSLLYHFYFEKTAEPWGDVAGFVDSHAIENDTVIVEPAYARNSFERYSARDDVPVFNGRGNITGGNGRRWLVLRYKDLEESYKKFTPLEKEKFGNITIYLINTSENTNS